MERPLEIFNKLSEEKRALLALRLKEKFREQNKNSVIPRLDGTGPFPLSFAQQRLWFLWHLQPESPLYNNPLAARLSGPLNVAALERTLDEIVRRHKILRTVFPVVEGTPVQVIPPHRPMKIPFVRLSHLSGAEREAEVRRLADEEMQRPFDLMAEPALRARFIGLGEREHVLLLNMHHIVTDGWSMGVLVREVMALYEAFSNGEPSPLPELPIQYADYAVWQREWLQGAVLEELLAYWKEQLAEPLSVLDLPTDRPRPAAQSVRGGIERFELSVSLSEGLRSLCQSEQVTLYTCLLAAFQTLLHLYTRQDDIVVGTSNANRNLEQVENLIGFFVNTLVIRTDVSGDPTFRELLRRVRAVATAAIEHRDMPFDKLVEVLKPERNLNRTPLFQVMFDFHNWQEKPLELPGIEVSGIAGTHTTSKFDLALVTSELGQKIRGALEYNSDLFNADTITRLLSHFKMLLGGIVSNPDRPVSSLPLLSPRQQQQLLSASAPPATDFSPGRCLHEIFERQAARTPGRVAVTFEAESLTYAELDGRSNQLAHYLRRLGVGADTLVGVCTERSVEMVVALLGVLKAGGAYVPLDPQYPQERLSFMLEDAGAPVLLTQSRLAEQLPARESRVVRLDGDWNEIAGESRAPLGRTACPQSLAYVIYTSGSTGRPKGVMVSHDNAARLFTAADEWFRFGEEDVWTLFHSYAFDFSVWELWGALLYGGRLVVVPYMVSRSPEAFRELLVREKVTVLNQTPSAFRQLMRADESAPGRDDLSLRLIIFGGEALELQTLKPWFERHGDVRPRLVNMYGITETTVHVTYRPLKAADLSATTGSRIGVPIPDLQVYILDRHLRPVPVGVPGEMYVGGCGVARGYLNRPELTAQRFVAHPFDGEPGARLYRSGDLARRLADGDIEYLGRIDQQVKIRGFRIEPGEIEAALSEHPSVADAVVLAGDGDAGEKRLAGYVVTRDGAELSAGELRAALKERLPDYMIPHAFVFLDAIPLTPNGKVNRRALPAPDQSRADSAGDYVAPRNPVEQALAEAWAEVLGVERVGVRDNFFELGGDSILSIRIIAKAQQAGLKLSPKHLFQYQTIATLAEVATQADADANTREPVAGAVPLTPIQHWFFDQNLPAPHHYNQAVMFETRRALDTSILDEAVRELLRHHDALRLRFNRHEDGWRQVGSAGDEPTVFVKVDLNGVPEGEQVRAVEAKAAQLQTTLNLSQGPLVRVAYFDLGPGRHGRLLMVVHHLVVDAVSWSILLEDLQTAYEQLSEGRAAELPPKTTSFKEWAEGLCAYARGEELRREVPYWLDESRRDVRPLPSDYAGRPNTKESAGALTIRLSREETRRLLQEAPAFYNLRINDLLLTAVAHAFREWTGQPSFLIDVEGHGREELLEGVDLTRTVGWFTAIYPILLRLPENGRVVEGLKSIKEQLRGIPRRGVGYGLLRYLSDDEGLIERLRQLPRAEVSFNYLGQLDRVLSESSPFVPTRESAGPEYDSAGERPHLLDINASVAGGRLQLTWVYSRNLHHPSTVEKLADHCLAALRTLVAHARVPGATAYTPSDYPEAGLGQSELDRLWEQLPGPEKGNIEDIYPLSPMQEGMLFHSVYAPQSLSYFVQMAYTLKGALDLPTLERAWRKVVERNGVLRTSFAWERLREPLQLVHREVEPLWEQQDWRGLSAAEQGERLKEYLRADKRRGFDLSRPPLLRIAVLRIADDAYHFAFSHHHLVLDGWSVPLLFKELFLNYDALGRGHEVTAKPGRPYKDYISWLRRQDLARAEQFWRQTLKGFNAPTYLSGDGDHGAAPVPHGDFAARHLRLPAPTTSALRTLSQQHRLTMNTLVQGAWALLLSHLSGREDVVYGSAVSGRPAALAEVDTMVGLFINTLPVRVRVREGETLLRWLGELQAALVETYEYAYTPLVKIHGWSEVPRGLPLFDTHVSFDNYPTGSPLGESERGFEIEHVEAVDWNDFPLSLAVGVGDELTASIKYDRQSFADGSIETMASHLVTLLGRFADAQDASVGELMGLLAEAERQRRSAERRDFREQRHRKLRSTIPKPVSAPAHEKEDHERA